MVLTSPPTTVAPFDKGRLAAGISASDTSLTVGAIFKTVNGVRVKQGLNTSSGCAIISQGDFSELVTFTGSSVNSTTKVTTITGLTRGRDPTQTTASGSFAAGTGRAWAKGAKFTVVDDVTYNQSGVFTNVANVFTAAQTFSEAPIFSKGRHTTPFANAAARDAYFTAPTNGDEAYLTAEGYWTDYVGGAWAARASGTNPNAANGTAGKVDIATAAEVAAGTATDGTSGALNVIPVSITKTTSTGAVSGSVVALNTSVMVDGSIGGLGAATPALGKIPVGSAVNEAMTFIGPGSNGQVPTSNGTTIVMATPTKKSDVVLMGASSSTGVGDNSTAENNIGTYTYTIPANDLVDGVRYVIDVSGTLTYADATNDPTFRVKLGSTTIASTAMTNIGSTISVNIRAYVYGTAAAGGAVTVRGGITVIAGSGTATGADIGVGDGSASVATNGTLVLQLSQQNSVSGTPYNIVLKSGTITKESSTAF